ncbi:TIGR03032 family protein [Cognatishimia sp. F0-27]|uniref:TIGR03032 family protein n=1 Tax=Cognatishimia sp. F0-27 TaxID=2816855 RepID=UPI001D0C4311|nr:TIGR03032 family protein [Cognatishimia sp. F0-27]MCC1494329.1 TIGR03032 family protein [Cognatishimia sp. F0-27]
MPADPSPNGAKGPILQHSAGFPAWLEQQNCSLVLSTYQAGRIIVIGRKDNGALHAQERLIDGCKGLCSPDGHTLWASGSHTVWRFQNTLAPDQLAKTGADRVFTPLEGRVTGNIDIHEMALGDPGQFGGASGNAPLFVSSAFNCLGTISQTASFQALWRPPFITSREGGDRCHLNGLAMDGKRAAYVSMTSTADTVDGWRERRRDGGVIMDMETTRPVCDGLSMPHSPRLYDGSLWFLNSGQGQMCKIDPVTETKTAVARCPGFARGLAFIGRYAAIGLSKPRRNAVFEGLPLDEVLAETDTKPVCGVQIVDIDTGNVVHWLRFVHTIEELFDVLILPGVRQPEIIGFQGDAIGSLVVVSEV